MQIPGYEKDVPLIVFPYNNKINGNVQNRGMLNMMRYSHGYIRLCQHLNNRSQQNKVLM